MLSAEHERLKGWIRRLAHENNGSRRSLIPILRRLQAEQGHVSESAMQAVADALGVHPAEVHGVTTFYEFLDREPHGRFVVRLCRTVSCDMQNKDAIARQLENDLGIDFGETTPDGMFTLEWCNCLGMCDQGPALMVGTRLHTAVTADRVAGIIEECRRAPHEARALGEERER